MTGVQTCALPILQLFSLIPSDLGRPLADLSHRLENDFIVAEAQRVLERLVPVEREQRSREGRWYLVRLLPYRTAEDRIAGVALTFVDVTARKEVEAQLQEQAALLELAPVLVRGLDGRIVRWTQGAQRLYGFSKAEALGRVSHELLQTQFPD